MIRNTFLLSFFILTWIFISCSESTFQIKVETTSDAPQIQYAVDQLKEAASLGTIEYDRNELVIATAIDDKLEHEAFEIEVDKGKVRNHWW